jgi:hypothetical protein
MMMYPFDRAGDGTEAAMRSDERAIRSRPQMPLGTHRAESWRASRPRELQATRGGPREDCARRMVGRKTSDATRSAGACNTGDARTAEGMAANSVVAPPEKTHG